MPVFTDHFFLSCDGKTNIHYRLCTPEQPLRGIVQIAHGIAEHVERYDAFARFLAERGFLVAANDHLGHGQSVSGPEDLGFFAEEKGWDKAVGDMKKLRDLMAGGHPGLPYFLFGHSMGSFLTRTYLIKYPQDLSGAVICGTGQQAPAVVTGGKLMGRLSAGRGLRYKSEKLNDLAFGSYNKRYKEHRTPYDWLSRDDAEVDKYIADPLCGFIPSVGLFLNMMGGIEFIGSKKNCGGMKKDLPILIISGDMDPVGEYGKGVTRVYRLFQSVGMSDVTMKLYRDCRHELLNERNRDEVMNDVCAWLESKMK